VKRLLIVAFFVLRSPLNVAAADKTDLVLMSNGDRFIGEIKKLAYGQLTFKASYMTDDANLDWTKVAQLQSVRHFRVELSNGAFRSGTILKRASSADTTEDFEVAAADGTTSVNALNVVAIEALERSKWNRFDVSVDLGFTLNPENDQTQFTANANVDYPSERFRVTSQLNSQFSKQEGAEESVHQSAGFSYQYFLSKNWFVFGLTQFLKDSQLDLDLRTTVAGGVGRNLIFTNRTVVTGMGGLAVNHEKFLDSPASTTVEGVLGVEFYTFRFDASQLRTRLLVYPGLSEWGRVRLDWQSSITWKINKDIFWKVSAIENFDSRPPEGSNRNDFTLSNTFGVSF
jgi:putative salt-induced outer membrane protein YdiY